VAIALPPGPARDDLLAGRPTLWLNPDLRPGGIAADTLPVRPSQVDEAVANWKRLAPVLEACFPDLAATGGAIRSALLEARALRDALGYGDAGFGRVFVKADDALPVAGSIKARGGIYEVFMFAERLVRDRGLLADGGDIRLLAGPAARELFSAHTVAVGSTGNLGLSVGTAARSLGFRAVVHMSSDAKAWKVQRLIAMGVDVVRHEADYTAAVAQARADAEADPSIYFVDDERSELLFFGYSAAARELAGQLRVAGVAVDADHPLFLYLPCGIGGAPGGVAYGAKAEFGDAAHCFFVEPVQSACALAHMMSGFGPLVSVYDVGLTNRTEADGMAVARMSAFVAEVIRPLLSGIFTVTDDDLFRWLHVAQATQGIRLEPSAAASFAGPGFVLRSPAGRAYIDRHGLRERMPAATHVLWTTGGSFVPQAQFEAFMARGAALAGSAERLSSHGIGP
jgi:D-serine dehydratase